jgi:hypothetical protein
MTTETDALFEDMGRERAPDKAPTVKGDHPLIDRSRWGLFHDVDIAAYHAGFIEDVTLSQGGMGRLLNETPLDFAFANPQLNPDAEKLKATVAMHRGDVTHQLALGKGRGYAVGDFADWRTKEAKSFRDNAIADGLTPIKRAEFEDAEVMAEVIQERIKEALDGADYQTEVAFLYQEMTEAGPIWVRGMMDVWCEERDMILDPKITPQLYDAMVGRQLVNMGWDRQAALYSHAVGMILPERAGRIKFRDLMVKPSEPFTSRIVALEKAWEYSAIKQCRMAMELFGKCLYAGRWPGFEGVHFVQLPGWEDKRREAQEIGA